jgi:N-acetylmuramoyl-L-alanine amidase
MDVWAARLLGRTRRASRAGVAALLLGLLAVLTVFPVASVFAAPLLATEYKMAGDATRMRLALHFDREPDVKWFLLRSPYRLVIDLPETDFAIDPKELKARGLINGVRYGRHGQEASRLVLVAKGPFDVERIDVLKNETDEGYRLVADVVAGSRKGFDAALAAQSLTTGSTVSTPKGGRVGSGEFSSKRFAVVIDPGHGGIDGGAEGVGGTVEKTITLAFSLELRAALEATGKYDVFMTRDRDDFLALDERVRFAREHDADLLISIHADTIRYKNIRGATVYTVSDRASDADAEATADRENLSDQLAGIEVPQEDHEVADILVDLIRRETHSFSIRFARSLVGELSNSIEMIKNPHRYAGFRVLKAPDVPSVLVELGYLSNPRDEEELRDAHWRGKAVKSIVAAIDHFAGVKRGAGG